MLDLHHLPLTGQVRPVQPLGDHPVQSRTLERVQPLRALRGVLGGARDVAPLFFIDRVGQRDATHPERLTHQRRVPGGERVETDEVRRCLLGQYLDPTGGRMNALRE